MQILDLPQRADAQQGEIRLKVLAASVNPVDIAMRVGSSAAPLAEAPPYVPGMDAAGVIEQIGPGTETDLQVGDVVMAVVIPRGSMGAYAEQVIVPAESVARIPAGRSVAEAATIPMNGLTARLALDTLNLKPGETVAVTGAAGLLGGYVIQLAKHDGLHVVADASTDDEALVKKLGADVVLRRGRGFAERVRALLPDGAHGAVDAAVVNELLEPAVRDGGSIATVRGFSRPNDRNVSYEVIFVPKYARNQAALDQLRRQVEDGVLTVRLAATMPIDQAADAQRILEKGGLRGRIVLEV
ncbi:hypothetical protein MBRU_07385 [Mycolicibacterium brumae DSM 44177]|nr:hypothetical protein MBRU_07385 [Mycolicibacterium brumae DSM 44177]